MARAKLLHGKTQDIIDANIGMLKNAGYEHSRAVRCALCHANKNHAAHAKKVAAKAAKQTDRMVLKPGGRNA